MKKVALDVAVSCPLQIWAIVLSSRMGKEIVLGNMAKQVFVLFYFLICFFFSDFKVTLWVTIPGRHTLYNTQHKTQGEGLLSWSVWKYFKETETQHLFVFRSSPLYVSTYYTRRWRLRFVTRTLEIIKSWPSCFFDNVENLITLQYGVRAESSCAGAQWEWAEEWETSRIVSSPPPQLLLLSL